jgi:protein-S-isoprenylcysteine O-methyltransferase Ste14
MSKFIATVYGALAYVVFLGTLVWAIGFLGNYLVPQSLDSGRQGEVLPSLVIDVGLLGLFALQHSLMARPFFKNWWTRFVPKPVERSTYVLLSSLLLGLLFWQWQPLAGAIWQLEDSFVGMILQIIYFGGWLIAITSTFMTNHFDFFGLRQVYLNLKGQPYQNLSMSTAYLYKLVRHPLMLGLIIVFWATPTMSVGHLLFAIASSGYILVGIQLEEHDLLKFYGDTYRHYQQKVSMLLPLVKVWGKDQKEINEGKADI